MTQARDTAQDLHTRYLSIMLGPSHPAMHGTIKMDVAVDGETLVEIDVDPGYLHRGFEKECEDHKWNQCVTYTDRLNYVSAIINNVAYAMAVEKLLGIDKQIPERALWLRMILSEVSRISDHLTCLAAMCMETGGFTAFLYFIKAREYFYEILENVTGARVTYSWTRIGGVRWDAPEGFEIQLREAIKNTRKVLKDIHGLFDKNRIFLERTVKVGVITQENAIAYGITGPFLRSTGFNYDVRKAHPYLFYQDMDFEVPLGVNGDNYDRYYVRMLEMEQSMRIIEQAIPRMPKGPVMLNDPHLALPEKEKVYNTIEGVINHFKLIFEDITVSAGEVYNFVESPNGELGFYIISKGGNKPWKMRVHPPCFPIMQALPEILKGLMIADIIPTFGSVNMIGGEMDR
jgi:NADH-quinone oxidoreductase subunit D